MKKRREVVLRDEQVGPDSRRLWAYLNDKGDLHIDGQDLGPSTAPVSNDGEYEWSRKIEAEHLPRLLALLGGAPGSDLLDILEKRWSGPRSGDLEKLIREGEIPTKLWVHSG